MATAGAKVTVGCKVGLPWIDLQLCKPEEVYENTQTGPRKIKVYRKIGPIVRLRGTAYPRGEAPEGYPAKPEMVAGAVLNHGIDKSWWDEWVKQNAQSTFVVNKMIFAHEKVESVKAEATELKELLSGFEPIARTKDGITDKRLPRSSMAGVSNVEPARAG